MEKAGQADGSTLSFLFPHATTHAQDEHTRPRPRSRAGHSCPQGGCAVERECVSRARARETRDMGRRRGWLPRGPIRIHLRLSRRLSPSGPHLQFDVGPYLKQRAALLASFIALVIVNVAAGSRNRATSDQFYTPITPSGWTFAG